MDWFMGALAAVGLSSAKVEFPVYVPMAACSALAQHLPNPDEKLDEGGSTSFSNVTMGAMFMVGCNMAEEKARVAAVGQWETTPDDKKRGCVAKIRNGSQIDAEPGRKITIPPGYVALKNCLDGKL